MKKHIYSSLISQRRLLGLSQQELAVRAGLRREKLNRLESRAEDIGIDDLCRLCDAVGLELRVSKKEVDQSAEPAVAPRSELPSRSASADHHLMPEEFHRAAFIDGSKARIVDWGKVPK